MPIVDFNRAELLHSKSNGKIKIDDTDSQILSTTALFEPI